MGSVVQLVGALLCVAGGTWLFGPWLLVGGGVALLAAPEVAAALVVRRARRGGAR